MTGESTVSVLVPVAVGRTLHLSRPRRQPTPGDIVDVPLGTRDVVGVVWDDPPDQAIGHNRLRPINGTFDAPPLSAEIRRFVDWVADYTLTSPRHGPAHGAARAGRARARGADPRRAPRRPAAGPHDAGAPARAGHPPGKRWRLWSRLDEERPCRRRRRHAERRAGADRRRHAGGGDDAGAAGRATARSRLCATGTQRRAGGGRGDAARRHRRRAATRSRCSTASPAPARPRSISRRSPRR